MISILQKYSQKKKVVIADVTAFFHNG